MKERALGYCQKVANLKTNRFFATKPHETEVALFYWENTCEWTNDKNDWMLPDEKYTTFHLASKVALRITEFSNWYGPWSNLMRGAERLVLWENMYMHPQTTAPGVGCTNNSRIIDVLQQRVLILIYLMNASFMLWFQSCMISIFITYRQIAQRLRSSTRPIYLMRCFGFIRQRMDLLRQTHAWKPPPTVKELLSMFVIGILVPEIFQQVLSDLWGNACHSCTCADKILYRRNLCLHHIREVQQIRPLLLRLPHCHIGETFTVW